MICRCGHIEDAHTEIGIFPPCEGAMWPPERTDPGFKRAYDIEPCKCQGWEPVL